MLKDLGEGPFGMGNIGKCPKGHGPPPVEAQAAAEIAANTRSRDWRHTKLSAARLSRHLFAFENTGVSFDPAQVAKAVDRIDEEGYVSEKAMDAIGAGAVPIFHGAEEYLNDMLPVPVQVAGEVWQHAKSSSAEMQRRLLLQDPKPGPTRQGNESDYSLQGTAGFLARFGGWRLDHLEPS